MSGAVFRFSAFLCLLVSFVSRAEHDGATQRSAPDCQTFPIGNESPVSYPDYVRHFYVSPDGKYIAIQSGDYLNILSWPDLKLVTRCHHDEEIKQVVFSRDGRFVGSGGGQGGLRVTDLQSKKQVFNEEGLGRVSILDFSPDGKRLVAVGWENLRVFDLTSGRVTFEKDGRFSDAKFNKDGSGIIAAAEYKVIHFDLQGKAGFEFAAEWTKLGPAGEVALLRTDKNLVIAYDTSNGKELWRKPPLETNISVQFDPNGNVVIHNYPAENPYPRPGRVSVIEPKSGRVFREVPVKSHVNYVIFSRDGSTVGLMTPHEQFQLYDVASGARIPTGPQLSNNWGGAFSADGRSLFIGAEGGLRLRSLETRCVSPESLTDENRKAAIRRLQKPGSLDLKKDLPVLLGVLRDAASVEKYPNETRSILENVLESSNILYQDLLGRYPHLKRLPRGANTELYNRTAEDESHAQKATAQYLKDLIALRGPRTDFADWDVLRPLDRRLARLTDDKKENFIHLITERIADKAADDPKFQGIFHSKLYYFAKQAVVPMFGEKPRPLTDLTVVRTGALLEPKILGVVPVDGEVSTETPYGFYMRSVPTISMGDYERTPGKPIDLKTKGHVEWTQKGEKYSAELTVTPLEKSDFLVPDVKMPYEKLWKDGALTGMVITGTNLKGLAQGVLDEYLSYYKQQGFEFGAPQGIKNLGRYFEKGVKDGSVDYLIKEAHSDGDEKNLFRYDKSAYEVVGVKRLPGGRKEVVHLIFPNPSEHETELLPNHQFGEWIRDREKSGGTPLIYFNTSCWSCRKATHEIEAARSKTLINIPATTFVNTFSNWPTNAEKLLLDAFRARKSYEQMREALKANADYREGKGNFFVFPDDADYQRQVLGALEFPIDLRIMLRNSSGRPLNIDQIR